MAKRTRTQPLTVSISDYEHPAIAALEEKEVKYAVFPDSAQRILVFLGGEHGYINVSCIHDQDDGLIIFHSTYPIKAGELARAETVRLLNHLNNALPGPAFRLDPDDGEIVFRHCLHLGADGNLDPDALIDALALCRAAIDRSLPLIPAVALGQSTCASVLAPSPHSPSDN